MPDIRHEDNCTCNPFLDADLIPSKDAIVANKDGTTSQAFYSRRTINTVWHRIDHVGQPPSNDPEQQEAAKTPDNSVHPAAPDVPTAADMYDYLAQLSLRAMADAGHLKLPASGVQINQLMQHPHVRPFVDRFADMYDPSDPQWQPLIDAWRNRTHTAEPYYPTRRGSLPRLHRIGLDDAQLPDFPADTSSPPHQQMEMFDLPAITNCPSWLLWLYDKAGGESMAQGRGAPWPLRLFVGALLHLAIHNRDGEWHVLRFRTDEVIAWLHPDGWANKRRDWEKLPAALDAMRERLAYVPVPGLGSVAMLVPSVIPRTPGDPLVEFTVRIPQVAAQGASIDWPTLCQYGKESAALYRAYLSAIAFMDRAAHRGHGITAKIGMPEFDDKGKLKRRKGGALVRSSTELIDNKAARYVKGLDDKDLTRMIGFDPDNRSQRQDTRAAFERLHADKVIDLQREGKGVRIFQPFPSQPS